MMTGNTNDNILYEIFMYAEWKPDPEVLKQDMGRFSHIVKSKPFRWLRCFQIQKTSLSEMISSNIAQQQNWQICLGDNGKVIAVLGDTVLEIRTKRGDYSSIVSRAKVPKDHYPQWRKLSWSPDCSLLAIAQSNGVVSFYDLTGANLFNVPADCHQPSESKCSDRTHAVASIVFVPVRHKENKWSHEVLIIDYRGALRSFSVSPTDGFKLNHTFNFDGGIAACTYNKTHNILYVAGLPILGEKNLKNPGYYGLAAWRLLLDAPFYKLSVASDRSDILPNSSFIWSYILSWNKSLRNIVFDFSISPGGNSMICLHTNGEITLWHLPALRLLHIWPLVTQPQANIRNPLISSKSAINNFEFIASKAAWWNDEAIILARNNGAVSVCRIGDLQNLLGEIPEFLQGCPQITEAFDNTFLALECELKPMTVNEFRRSSDGDTSAELSNSSNLQHLSDSSESQSDTNIVSLVDRSTDFLKYLVFWITDMERFQPKPKKLTLVSKIYRLLGLKSTTPNELYLRKIESGEYTEALSLAEKYNLDFDLVYQQKWRKSRVSLDSIKDSLMKVTKRSWIVHQCCDRLPETLTAAKELLKFGLEVTDVEIEKDLKSNYSKTSEAIPTLAEMKMDDLSLYSTELLRCRHLMLFYIDRLELYENIIKQEDSCYQSEEYHRLRNNSILKCAIDYANKGRITPLICLWPLINNQAMKLAILNNLPETINPQEYRVLITNNTSINSSGNKDLTVRKKDWCENLIFSSVWSSTWSNESTPEYEDENLPIATVDMSEWFINRAIEIEKLTGVTNNALALIKVGKEMNLQNLNEIYNNLLVLEILVYDLGITNVSIEKLQECSHLQICYHLMTKTSNETFISDLKRFILPYSLRQEKFLNLPPIQFNLLVDYLVNLSKEDLTFPVIALQNRLELGLSVKESVAIAEQCLLNNTRPEQLPLCYSILYEIPRESDDTSTPGHLIKVTEDIERILSSCSILESHGIKMTFAELKAMCTDVKQVHLLLKQMTHSVSSSDKFQSCKYNWEGLFSNILDLRSKVFPCADLEVCLEIYASALLSSGDSASIKLASKVLTCSIQEDIALRDDPRSGKVPLNRSIELVLKTSKDYFNSASALNDITLELARTCLSLIDCDNKEIVEESDLLSSLQILKEFGIQMLPIQVRLCNDKMMLINECLKSNKYAYQSDQKLLQLARFFRIGGNDERTREALILESVGMKAISDNSDTLGLAAAASAATRLAAGRHARGWKLAWQVASQMPNIDRNLRMNLLAFALMHCSPDYIQNMLQTRLKLESELLQERQDQTMEIFDLQNNMDSQDSVDSNDEEFNDALTSPTTDDFPLIREIDKHFRGVSNTLYNNRWKRPFGHFLKRSEKDNKEEESDKEKPCKTVCQEFYKQIYPFCNISSVATQYDKFSMPDAVNKHLFLYLSLLRIHAIDDCLNLGRNIIQFDEVLAHCAEYAAIEDTALSVSLLLTTKDVHTCWNYMDYWPKTFQYIYIRMYYILIKSLIHKDNNAFMWNPKTIFFSVTECEEGHLTNDNPESTVSKYLWKCFESLKDGLQNEKIKRLDPNINLTLFNIDSDYKTSCILGLAKSSNQSKLQLALELADKYEVPRFDVCFTHIEYLIANYDTIGFDVCLSQLNIPDILPILKDNVTSLIQRLTSETWNKIDGVKHQELLLFFTIIEIICGNHTVFSLTVKEHIKLLKKIKSISCDLDYKLMLKKPTSNEMIEHIVPLLRIDNVGMVTKLLRILTSNLNIKLDLSNLYRKWLVNLYFSIPSHADTSKKWMQQFRECLTYFNKMSKTDIVDFVREICFSSSGVNRVPIITRSIIIKQTLDYFHFENIESSSKLSDLSLWEEPKSDLNKMSQFLDALSNAPIKHILSERPDLEIVFRELERAYGKQELILSTLEDLTLKHDLSLSDIHCIIENLIPEYPMNNFIQYLLEQHQDNYDITRNIINKVTLDGGENNGVSKQILNKLKIFATGKFTPSEEWIKVIFLCKDTDLTEEKRSQLLNQYSSEMIKSQWSEELSLDEIDFTLEECRLNLINKILTGKMLNTNQIKVLVDLMNYWPPFNVDVSENEDPRLLLTQKMLELDDNDVTRQLKIFFENQNLASNEIKWVIENTPNASVKQLLYLILLSKDKILYDLIPFYLSKSNISVTDAMDDSLAEIIIREKLAVKFIGTAFYPHLIHFLANKPFERGVVEEIISELVKLDHLAEASALRLALIGIPASLKSFSTKISL